MPLTMGKSSVVAAVLVAGLCPAANALRTAPPPVINHPTASPLRHEDLQKWWLIDEAKSLHSQATRQAAPSETSMEKLHGDWENKMGKGSPVFSTRRIDFHKPALAFEYTFPNADPGHKTVLGPVGIYEPLLSIHAGNVFRECCKHGSGHFLDVGAQYGWYSLLSASYGCSADAFEPVPWFQSLLAYNTMANTASGLAGKVTRHPGKFLGNSSGARHTIVIPTDGKAPGPQGAKESQCDHGAVCVDVTETLASEEMADLAIQEETIHAWPSVRVQSCGVRVSAQGTEPQVMQGAQSFITERRPKFVMIEVRPGMQKAAKRSNKPAEEMLDYVIKLGYVAHLLSWETVRTQNLKVAGGSLHSKRFSQPVSELVRKCGANCIVYLELAA